jgi:hypothetical protein
MLKVKMTSQTMGNAQFGGVQDGYFSAAYHAPGRNAPPLEAAAKFSATKAPSEIQIEPSIDERLHC